LGSFSPLVTGNQYGAANVLVVNRLFDRELIGEGNIFPGQQF